MNKIKTFSICASGNFCMQPPAEVRKSDPLESGRGFIESSLKGDYMKLKNISCRTVQIFNILMGIKISTVKEAMLEKEGYRDANILIDSTQKISDSVTIITYSNTYKNKPTKLKMVKKNNEWLVDFKYSFTDSL